MQFGCSLNSKTFMPEFTGDQDGYNPFEGLVLGYEMMRRIGYSYVEAFFSMNQEYWTAAHVNAFRYFGGVPRMIQCDNLKTGVEKHGKDEVILNKTYQELAEHYATAIVPARVRAPKDKAAVEGTVGIISTFILAALRNRQFLSLSELNAAVWERLEAFNTKPSLVHFRIFPNGIQSRLGQSAVRFQSSHITSHANSLFYQLPLISI